MTVPAYAELGAATNYSFLRGASHPDELVTAARALGLAALGVADRNSLAGVVRAHTAAREQGLRLLVGARLVPQDGPEILCFPEDRAAYGRLSLLLTEGKRRAPKGQCFLALADIEAAAQGQCLAILPPAALAALGDPAFAATLRRLARLWRGRVWLAMVARYDGADRRRFAALAALAAAAGLPLLASNDVLMHSAGRKPLLDLLACIREKRTIDEAGFLAAGNAERRLKAPAEMAALFRDYPAALAATLEIVERCRFALSELRYEYPDEIAPDGRPPQQVLAEEAWAGAAKRYPGGVPAKVRGLIEHELALIGRLDYARFFLTVHDAVRFARGRGILCQGRGSAANSAVCYCLGITAVDPARLDLLFERFVSAERARAARHRRRLRARAARGGDPVHLPQVRPRPRRPGRDGDPLPHARRGARRRQGAGARRRHHRGDLRQHLGLEPGGRRRAGAARTGARPGGAAPGALPAAGARAGRLSPPPLAACRRLRHHQGPPLRAGADRERGDGGPHRHRVGQGRPRRARPHQGRRAGARHADLHPQGLRPDAPRITAGVTTWPPSRPRTRRSTTCSAAPIRSASSRSRAGRRCRCCRA